MDYGAEEASQQYESELPRRSIGDHPAPFATRAAGVGDLDPGNVVEAALIDHHSY